jgi:hypothetical protein
LAPTLQSTVVNKMDRVIDGVIEAPKNLDVAIVLSMEWFLRISDRSRPVKFSDLFNGNTCRGSHICASAQAPVDKC